MTVSRKLAAAVTLLAVLLAMACTALPACSPSATSAVTSAREVSRYLNFLDEEPNTVDPQCTSEYYTVPLNIYDRLIEVDKDKSESGEGSFTGSLAQSWDISDDGLVYTFHLREGVTFSNGETLASDDVEYTFLRMLAYPDSCQADLVTNVLGADDVLEGKADTLKGFEIVDDATFKVTLAQPNASFLAGLSTPGASILDKGTTMRAGGSYGKRGGVAVGTGPFVLSEWEKGKRIVMDANPSWWGGNLNCDGLSMLFYSEKTPMRTMFANGELDVLDLDMLDRDAEYFLRGDIYQNSLVSGPRVGITYIALNQSVKPLGDVRVRKALQMALDRETLLQVVAGGRGALENGIFPTGLAGHNDNLPEILYDPGKARKLLKEAGYEKGFDLRIVCTSTSSQSARDLLNIAASMWKKIGVNAFVEEMPESEFLDLRGKGGVACYTGTWSADYDDPDNFIYTFFGSSANTTNRSLCYPDEDVMKRVRDARSIVDVDERMAEYQALEEKIVQDDAAWIPLFSRTHSFVLADRVTGFKVGWSGWSNMRYSDVVIEGGGE